MGQVDQISPLLVASPLNGLLVLRPPFRWIATVEEALAALERVLGLAAAGRDAPQTACGETPQPLRPADGLARRRASHIGGDDSPTILLPARENMLRFPRPAGKWPALLK